MPCSVPTGIIAEGLQAQSAAGPLEHQLQAGAALLRGQVNSLRHVLMRETEPWGLYRQILTVRLLLMTFHFSA